jgi:NAD kinase
VIHQKNAENKMSISDIKIYAMNAGALGVTTFTQIEDGLKIFLLIVTIGYTISKWIELKKDKNNGV